MKINNGFTLIEVIIVMALFAVTVSLGMTMISGISNTRTDSKAKIDKIKLDLEKFRGELSVAQYAFLGSLNNGSFSVVCKNKISTTDLSIGTSSHLNIQYAVGLPIPAKNKISDTEFKNLLCADTVNGLEVKLVREIASSSNPYLLKPVLIPMILKNGPILVDSDLVGTSTASTTISGFSTTTLSLQINKFGYVYFENINE